LSLLLELWASKLLRYATTSAREFRDRYMEEVNSEGGERLLGGNGKYDVSRQLEAGGAPAMMEIEQVPLLKAA